MGILRRAVARFDELAGVERIETLFYEATKSNGHDTSFDVRRELRPERLISAVGGGLDAPLIARRKEDGDECRTVAIDGRIAHYSWIKRSGEIDLMEVGIKEPVQRGEFWIYHCWTEPWARGRRIYPAVLNHILHEQFDAGMRCARIYTLRSNAASQRGIARAPFRYTGSVKSLRVGKHYFHIGEPAVAVLQRAS